MRRESQRILPRRISTIDVGARCVTNSEIADAFDELASLLEFTGANPFRVRAYRNAARTLRDLTEQISSVANDPERKLTDIEGIGDDLAAKIQGLLTTGELPLLTEMRSKVPASAMALLRIPGVGPKKAASLVKELNISTLDELREACQQHRVQHLKGFGKKTEELILLGLELAGEANKRWYWIEADGFVRELKHHLQGAPGLERLEAAGSYRRGKETVGDVDLLAIANEPNAVMDRLAGFPSVADIIGRGDTKLSLRLKSGLQVDLRVVPAESFGAALLYFTGSRDHNIELRARAKGLGLKINEYGVFRGEKSIAGQSEEQIYAALDLPLFPPELREARREFEWAAEGKLPKLIVVDDLLGDLHMHTTATDGQATLEEMVDAAEARGLKYIAITDHSKRVTMAHGLDAERLRAEWRAIDKLNKSRRKIQVLKGVEVDILEKGGLDLDDDVLSEADWVVASVHYGQNQPREQITARIVDALKTPHVSAIAHPTGRIISRRKPYELDFDAVLQAASDYGKLLELNSNPARLDLDDIHCAMAKEHGIPIVISTDAHDTESLALVRCGVMQARRAGLAKADVANTRPWEQIQKLIGRN
ncbi:MAG: DNA polymerase/3'-5' exonuclease PolX [Planctomycetes bacterium]|nr:DNA polymerase/3'-5' exonuclease PolX [Planctomycetota bacterium]